MKTTTQSEQPVIGMRDGIYRDSTPKLHVGNSSFEDWYQAHEKACTGDKQLARDAYAVGMGDPLVTYAQPTPAEYAQGYCEGFEDACKPAQPVQLDFEIVGYQFQWTNPANNTDHDGVMTKWSEVVPDWNQTVQQKIDQLLAYRYLGKPTYRVRVLYTTTGIAQPVQPTQAATQTEKLLQIIAATYQIAGAYDAPIHVLDVLANPTMATQEQIDALLPFMPVHPPLNPPLNPWDEQVALQMAELATRVAAQNVLQTIPKATL